MAQNLAIINKEEVIKFLQANLKDGGNRVGIETTTDGDPGPSIGLFTKLIYNYPHDHEKCYDDDADCPQCDGDGDDCSHCDGEGVIASSIEDASEVVVVNQVTVDDILKMINAMLD